MLSLNAGIGVMNHDQSAQQLIRSLCMAMRTAHTNLATLHNATKAILHQHDCLKSE